MFEIEFATLLEYALGILGSVVLVALTLVANKIGDKFKLDADSALRALVDETLEKAVAFGIQKLRDKAGDTSYTTDQEMVKVIADYVVASIPETLAHFGISEERLVAMVESRLGGKGND